MPIRTRILPRLGVVVSRGRGRLTIDDLRAHRRQVDAHPGHDRRYALLFDLRWVTELALSAGEIRDHAGFGGSTVARFERIAILTGADLTYGLSRVFQSYNRRYDEDSLRVFRDAAAAWVWARRSGTARGAD